jgi:hypothetical protein
MRLLSDQDHQALSTDNTLVMSVDDCQHLRPQYVSRGQHGIQRVCPGGMPLSITRIVPAGTPMPSGYRYQCRRMSKQSNLRLSSLKCAFHQTVIRVLLFKLLELLRPQVRL